jgi:hypothetical protein
VRLKKRRKPYLRYLWLNLNKTKNGINHFKNSISTVYIFFFQKVIQGQMIVNIIFSDSLVYFFIPTLKEIVFLNPTICCMSECA